MSKAFTLMSDGRTTTNRDFYYENVGLFGIYETVNGASEETCRILDVSYRYHYALTQFVVTEFLFKAIYLLVMQVTPVQLLFVANAKGLIAAGEDMSVCVKRNVG